MATAKYYDPVSGTWKYVLAGPKGDKGDKGDTGETGPQGPSGSGSGDMVAATYDPTNKASDAFSMDNMVETSTKKILTDTERTKLTSVATGATANATDASLRDRSTHTGTQTASTISDFDTAADARVVAGITGKVSGPASATDNAIVRFDGTTGKLVQNSGITVSDSGTVNIPTNNGINMSSGGFMSINIGDVYIDETEARLYNVISRGGATKVRDATTGWDTSLRSSGPSSDVDVYLPSTSTTLVGTGLAQTLTDKRINPRVSSATSASSLTPTIESYDQYCYTALAANLTLNAPTGTPVNGNKLLLRIKDNGTARTLTWNAIYRAVGVTLPTTTVASKTLYVDMIYNSADTKWDVIAISQES